MFCHVSTAGTCARFSPRAAALRMRVLMVMGGRSKRLEADLRSLRANDPALQALEYAHHPLSDKKLERLARAIRAHRYLRRLQLSGCAISSSGLRRFAVALGGGGSGATCRLRTLDLVSKRRSFRHDTPLVCRAPAPPTRVILSETRERAAWRRYVGYTHAHCNCAGSRIECIFMHETTSSI